eukprot:CAMPEP_0178912098 /NCGR_PEP_ID=MMETSP0786-20121207/10067_1 /TAXON_ID=186022 /ORGANISM="Thalassionema frauenfeldii, Strain CCMP 1798" /LENGTH=564 /DNA_ID=CAMNT_0020584629 /DNA_START=254 /DNA_END=1951 /DNA_ORIENTATION=+
MVLTPKRKGEPKKILNNVWGEAKEGELSAIMGSSGAGKTSLFNVLAGRVKSAGLITVESDIRLGGAPVDHNRRDIRTLFAFVAQEDALHAPSTPRQALTFSARLRLPRSTSKAEIDKMVNRYIEELGLSSCADSLIGGALKKGISGGEKRRVSIGIELITQPEILFLDEPTSGLDSYAAGQVLKLLRKVADVGNIVLFTIHQPSSNLFQSFDKLILLHKGELMYHGQVSDCVRDFGQAGYPVPNNYNTADWVIDVAQTTDMTEMKKNGFFPEENGSDIDIDVDTLSEISAPKAVGEQRASFFTQLAVLFGREWISLTKNPAPMIINVFITTFISVIFGLLFNGIGRQDRNNAAIVQAVTGALININISTMMGQSQTALVVFSSERPLFLREYYTDHYSIPPYFISHLATETLQCLVAMIVQACIAYFLVGFRQSFFEFLAITFTLAMTSTAVAVLLGACFKDEKSATATFTLVVVPQFYFSGVFIAVSLLPEWLRWAQYLCSLTYASRLSYAYEFGDCGEICDKTLVDQGVSVDDTWWYWLALLGLFVVFRLLAMVVLKYKSSY